MINIVYNGKFEERPITAVFAEFLGKSMETDPEVAYIDADLMALIGVRDVAAKYPDRVFNTGIMECNMVGVAAGLSLLGMKPYIHSFAAFVARRAFDQIFLSGAYAHKNMHIIASEPGIRQDFNGGTHMTFEDVALMRSIPDIRVIEITDSVMLKSVLEQTKDLPGLFYYRVPMNEIKKVYSEDSDMTVGKGNILCEGTDATVIAAGALVPAALEAAELLKKEKISVRVIDMFTIKPLDEELVLDSAKKTGAIVTAENASVYGGLGEGVARLIAEKNPVFVRTIAVKDEFGEVGPETYLMERYGFTAENIAEEVRKVVALKKRKEIEA